MKKGFTLIELLAVVIVLAVISLVATPIVLDAIEDVRSEANRQTAQGLINAAKNYYSESLLDTSKQYNVENKNDIYNLVEVTGEKPTDGKLYVNDEGKVAISIVIGNKCYVKGFDDSLQELNSESEDCDLGYISSDKINPSITLEIVGGEIGNDNWYTTSPYIKITASDLESGILNYKWCQGLECTPSNEETENGKIIAVVDSKEIEVCAISYDKALNESEKVCTDKLKVDTQTPEFSGIADITLQVNEEVDLVTGVSVVDSMSEVEGTFTYNPTNVDTSKTGITEVKYSVTDKAGNVKEITRKVIVSANFPTITYSVADGVINENGWSNKDFYVTINVTDNTGHGLKEFRVCTATTDTCDPSTGSVITNSNPATRLISTESNNNRICVQATDNTGQTSEVICSDAYKLDKTSPVVGTINITGELGKNDWYISDVIITSVDGSDILSGHDTTTVDITSITENTTGTKVTVTTKDLAGNIATNEYTIKVDKNTPTLTMLDNSSMYTNQSGNSIKIVNAVTSVSPTTTTCINESYENNIISTINNLLLGTNTITCTVTSEAGKTISQTNDYTIQLYRQASEISVANAAYYDEELNQVVIPPSGVSFGPYMKTKTGSYHVTINGSGFSNGNIKNNFTVRIYQYAESVTMDYLNLNLTDDKIEFDIIVEQDLVNNGIEIVTTSLGSQTNTYYIDSLEIVPVDYEIVTSPSILAWKANSVVYLDSGDWANEWISFRINGSTSTYSISHYEYCVDTTNTCEPNTTISGDKHITATGYIRYRAVGTTGAKSTINSFLGNIDLTKPSINYNYTIQSTTNLYGGEYYMGMFNTDLYPILTLEDNQSGIESTTIKLWKDGEWMSSNLIEDLGNNQYKISMTQEGTYILYVIAYDKAGNVSVYTREDDKNHLTIWEIDKTTPEISGISDITINVNETIDLTSGVEVSDSFSGINGTFTYSPTSIDTSKTGITEVIYTVTDNAGNTKNVTRKVIVSSDAPTINYTAASGAINDEGWANDDFYVTINVSDNSGHGIKSFNVCTATSDTCDPTNGSIISGQTIATRLISTESNNNRICVQAIDNYNQTSEIICSDAYKLDKTAPTAGTINITGTSGSNDWYTSDVTINVVNGSDTLSGHVSTTVDKTSVTGNTTGTTVTVTTKDLAGNISTRQYTIKIDKDAPVLTMLDDSVVYTNKSGSEENIVTSTSGTSSITTTCINESYNDSTVTIINNLLLGQNTVTCTATNEAGKTTTLTKTYTTKIYRDATNIQITGTATRDTTLGQIVLSQTGKIFGPYIKTKVGYYHVTITGSDFSSGTTGTDYAISVYQNNPSVTIEKTDLNVSTTTITFDIYVEEDLVGTGLEVVLTNKSSTYTYYIDSVEIVYLGTERYYATNLIVNGSFEDGLNDWYTSNTNHYPGTIVNDAYIGNNALRFGYDESGTGASYTSMTQQTLSLSAPVLNHQYYGALMFKSSTTFSVADNRFEWFYTDATNAHLVFANKSKKTTDWVKLSAIKSATESTYLSKTWYIRNFLVNPTDYAYADGLILIDLTEAFGEGNEPSKEWCDENIEWFEGTAYVYK